MGTDAEPVFTGGEAAGGVVVECTLIEEAGNGGEERGVNGGGSGVCLATGDVPEPVVQLRRDAVENRSPSMVRIGLEQAN